MISRNSEESERSGKSEKSRSRVYFCKDRNRVVVENDEFYISELCDLERDFEDEFFIECDPKELSLFYARNGSKFRVIYLIDDEDVSSWSTSSVYDFQVIIIFTDGNFDKKLFYCSNKSLIPKVINTKILDDFSVGKTWS